MRRPLILVADDREASLILFHQLLTSSGYDVVLAATSEEALAQARRHHPDLVLADPALAAAADGALPRGLRSDAGTARIPLAALTDRGGLDRELRDAGFCGVVHQRLPLRVVRETIGRCLESPAAGFCWSDLGAATSAA